VHRRKKATQCSIVERADSMVGLQAGGTSRSIPRTAAQFNDNPSMVQSAALSSTPA